MSSERSENGTLHSTDRLRVQVSRIPGIPESIEVSIEGCLGRINWAWFKSTVDRYLERHPAAVLFNFAGLEPPYEPGIGTLTSFVKTVMAYGGSMASCCAPAKTLEVLQLLGFVQFLNYHDSYQEAIVDLAQHYLDFKPRT